MCPGSRTRTGLGPLPVTPHGSAPMRHTSLAVVLGAILLLSTPGLVDAFPPSEFPYGNTNGPGCLASITCMLHQHGPLYNYGPYYGYPPFEPYGPWNAYLQYNPWYYGTPPAHGCVGCPPRDLSGHGGCGWSPSWHSSWHCGGWYHGCSSCSHGGIFTGSTGWVRGHASPSCKTCGITGSVSEMSAPIKATFNPETTDPALRYAGAGNAADFAVFYTGLPTLDISAAPAGGYAR
jgi:hypothetical protein